MDKKFKLGYAAAMLSICSLGYGLLGMMIDPPQSDFERSRYLLALVVGIGGLGLWVRSESADRHNRHYRPITYALLVAFGAGIVWAITAEPNIVNYISGWAALMALGSATLLGLMGKDEKRQKPLINAKWGKPLAAVIWLFALVAFGESVIGDVTEPATHPRIVCIVLTIAGTILWLLSCNNHVTRSAIDD